VGRKHIRRSERPSPPRSPKRRKRKGEGRKYLKFFVTGLLLVFALCAAAFVWLLFVYPKRPGQGTSEEKRMVLPRAKDLWHLAQDLEAHGVVEHALPWMLYARLRGAGGRLRYGAVYLNGRMTAGEVLRHVASGFGTAYARVVVPEGFDRFRIAERMEERRVCPREAFIQASVDPHLLRSLQIDAQSVEGYLFPDSYQFPMDSSCAHVIKTLVETWRRRMLPLLTQQADGMAQLHRDLRWELHDVLTLASIVEKEVTQSRERPIVAGVFLNRLRDRQFRPKRLQSDPTVTYGCLVDPQLYACMTGKKSITRAMLADSTNRYNTYRIEGLPPGPICNPGVASILAVLKPAKHNYLYFIANDKGAHIFSATLAEHNRARTNR